MARTYLSGNCFQKNGNWHIRYRLPSGLDTARKLGPAWTTRGEEPAPGTWTERMALRELDKILSKYEGWSPGADPLFKFAAAEFLERCEERRLSGGTTNRYRGIIDVDLNPAFGEKMLSSIDEPMVVNLHDALVGRMSPSSMNQTKVVLRGIVKHARRKRQYRGDDFSSWFEPETIRPSLDIDVFSPVEVEQLARTAASGAWRKDPRRKLSEFEIAERKRTDQQYAAIFKTAAYAGLRMSEIRALRWSDIDFAGEKITIKRGYTDHGGEGKPKSGKARTVPMAPQVAAVLDDLSRRGWCVEPEDLVFCGAYGDFLSHTIVYRAFLDACESAGLRRLRFHDLRHSAATLMIRRFPVSDVQAILGHANIATTMKYLHYVPRTESANKLGNLISEELNSDLPLLDEISRKENHK